MQSGIEKKKNDESQFVEIFIERMKTNNDNTYKKITFEDIDNVINDISFRFR